MGELLRFFLLLDLHLGLDGVGRCRKVANDGGRAEILDAALVSEGCGT